MTTDEEGFVHLAECIDSLNSAWSILKAVQSFDQNGPLRAAAYRMALVEYAKPYKVSNGSVNRRHRLELPQLDQSDVNLHAQILKLRDQVLAHSDINIKDAILHLRGMQGRPNSLIISNIPGPFPRTEDVIGLIERSLEKFYPKQMEWERRLGETRPAGVEPQSG